MLTLEYARAYTDELQRVANRSRLTSPTALARLLDRIKRAN